MNRREFVRRSALTGLGVAVSPMLIRSARAAAPPYIQAYPHTPSVSPGETMIFHVSTEEPELRITFCRQGAQLTAVGSTGWMAGSFAQPLPCDTNYEWPSYQVTIDSAWPSGVYVAMFETRRNGVISTPDESDPYGLYSKALFVVRGSTSGAARILYRLPFFTYHAYNYGQAYDSYPTFIGGNLVADLRPYYENGVYLGSRITLQRPGGGTGGDYNDGGWAWAHLADPYNGVSRRNAYSHWDAPFISWLEGNGYTVDYCTDLDLHNEGTFLLDKTRYKLMVSAGNDEYWSREMRDAMRSYVNSGGNLAFFTGNTGEWQIHVAEGGTSIYCDKDGSLLTGRDHWFDGQYEPSNQLAGGDIRNAGQADGAHDASGITVTYASHWVYKLTGLTNGAVFGDADRLVSYKAEGARYHHTAGGAIELDRNADDINFDTGPYNTRLLGYFEIGEEGAPLAGWTTFAREDPGNHPPLGATMTLYIVWQHPRETVLQIWNMNDDLDHIGDMRLDRSRLPLQWQVKGVADFNGDGSSDLLWQNSESGELLVWLLRDLEVAEEVRIDATGIPREWRLAGVGDLDGDGMPDLLWETERGAMAYSIIRDLRRVGDGTIDAPPTEGSSIVGIGDINGDGVNEVVVQNFQSGLITVRIVSELRWREDQVFGAVA